MEELQMLLSAVASVGNDAKVIFGLYCLKEIFIACIPPVCLCVVGLFIFKIIKYDHDVRQAMRDNKKY